MRRTALLASAALTITVMSTGDLVYAAESWRQPPQKILDVLHAPGPPLRRLSPTGETFALTQPLRYPPIADLAQPMLRLAGVRVNPLTNGRHGEGSTIDLLLLRVSDGSERRVAVPANARITEFQWSPDGRRFSFLNQTADGMELWVGDVSSAGARRIDGVRVNPILYGAVSWMPDRKTLLVKLVPAGRGAPPEKPPAPPGPRVQESSGGSGSSTYEARDVLTSPHDEALFEYYATSQLALIDAESGSVTPLGDPAILAGTGASPDGRHILVSRLHAPWSYSHAWYRFPRDVEVWDTRGRVEHVVARIPLEDQVPIQGVPEGPRDHDWRSTKPATLDWVEALDGGDPTRTASHRDRLMTQDLPFTEAPREIYRAPHRISGWSTGERGGLLVVSEYERERRWRHAWAIDLDAPDKAPRHIVDLSVNDRYNDPGSPLHKMLPNGHTVLLQEGDALFYAGAGSSPSGDRPFLDRVSLETLERDRLFRSDTTGYEYFIGWTDPSQRTAFLTSRESPSEPANVFVRTLAGRLEGAAAGEPEWNSTARMLTRLTDPTPELRKIQKRIVTYERADGTPLSFTLYLPPGYVEGTRLPTVIDAYPLEYTDPATAGQVTGSDRLFTRIGGPSSLFFVLDGYAVLQSVAMPVIGDPETAYDTFIEQLVASAEAAVQKAVEIGVADPARVGVMGHSHGALMTATLLGHSDLFRAGIARSGAYNHTMRPFGFQSERRKLWEARDTYVRLSPVLYADKINEPILIIHGEVDQNPGTVPLQSEKLFESVRGTGGTARLLMLPHEQHGYQSREAVEHVLAEQLEWFGRYVKDGGGVAGGSR